jgi:acetyltransferase-like isoleucine patch superfamily enzyme
VGTVAIAVLGAGPHGRQVAADFETYRLYDDRLDGYEAIAEGALKHGWIAGALWPSVRREIAAKCTTRPHNRGVYISPHAKIGMFVTFGDHVHVLASATVSHGCRIDEFATIATGAILCGEVIVEHDAFIGAGAVIIHGGIRIGAHSTVGAGAVVLEDVPPGATVVSPGLRTVRL